jgi:hypothetical protein
VEPQIVFLSYLQAQSFQNQPIEEKLHRYVAIPKRPNRHDFSCSVQNRAVMLPCINSLSASPLRYIAAETYLLHVSSTVKGISILCWPLSTNFFTEVANLENGVSTV